MIRDFLSQTDLVAFPLFTVLLFVGTFVGMLVWIFRPGAKAAYRERSMLALDDENRSTRHG